MYYQQKHKVIHGRLINIALIVGWKITMWRHVERRQSRPRWEPQRQHNQVKKNRRHFHMHVISVVWMDIKWQIVQSLLRCKTCCWLGERIVIEVVNGGNNSTNLENTNLDRRAIHIHGRMEHNLIGYAKYYSCGCIEILGNSEFTKETNHNRRDFFGHW